MTIGVILAAFALAPHSAAGGFVHPTRPTVAARPGAAVLVQLSVPGGGLSPELRAAHARLVSPALDQTGT